MSDGTLFDELNQPTPVATPRPIADHASRLSDPQSSHDGAALQGEALGASAMYVLRTLIEIERTNPSRIGATAAEIRLRQAYDSGPSMEKNVIGRRLTSLVRHGLVIVDGERRDGGCGVDVQVYRATAEGRAMAIAEAA